MVTKLFKDPLGSLCVHCHCRGLGWTVDQVHYHLELAEQYSVEWAKNIASGRLQGYYCGNGDRTLAFQIKKWIS